MNHGLQLWNERVVRIEGCGLAQCSERRLTLPEACLIECDAHAETRSVEPRRLQERQQHADAEFWLPELTVPGGELGAQAIFSEQDRTPAEANRNVELGPALHERTRERGGDQALALHVAFAFGALQLGAQCGKLGTFVAPARERWVRLQAPQSARCQIGETRIR
jgi:hypothetical protein